MAKSPTGPGRGGRPSRPNPSGASASRKTNTSTTSNQSRSGGQRPAAARRTAPPPASGIARFRQQHPTLAALIPVALVIVVVVILVVVKTTGGSGAGSPASSVATGTGASATNAGDSALPAGVLADVTSVSAATLAAIGEPSGTVSPIATSVKTPLKASNGKPEILFIGAEYCPYCAAERWSIVEALSRFGTFSGLSATHSSTSDVYPDTKTFSFYGATYTSTSLDFTSVELETNQPSGDSYTTLQTPTAAQTALLDQYDKAPYTTQAGSIPFLDIANKEISVGAGYTPQVLAGLSMKQIAADLNDKNSTVAIAIDGEANRLVAAITAATGVQPNNAATSATSASTTTTTTAVGS
jgi:hypothetical protein